MNGKFIRKAQFAAGGHMTDPPLSLTYATVVSRESVRITFLLAALNDLKVKAADIGNTCLNEQCHGRIWIQVEIEFGSNKGCVIVVKYEWYSLKSSGEADVDIWLRPQSKSSGEEYYKYALDESVGTPQRYLGGSVGKYQLEDGNSYWYTSAYDYCKAAVSNLKSNLEKEGIKLQTGRKADRSYPNKYWSEVDIMEELGYK
eukprot:2342828-Ditylum_brightwellii.AAC.1